MYAKGLAVAPPLRPPPNSGQFSCYFRPPKAGRIPDGLLSLVQPGASQGSNQFWVMGPTECGGWWVLSWVHSLALSKWTDGAAPFWANS